jgi:micrococcal nuclease
MSIKLGCRGKIILLICIVIVGRVAIAWVNTKLSTITGTVVTVIDGDTCDVRYRTWFREETARIRFASVDAPERGQPFWKASRDFLKERIIGKQVRILTEGRDRYRRLVGTVYLETNGVEEKVNLSLVEEGMAWWYQEYAPNDSHLAGLQNSAQMERRGIWSDPNPVPPWAYRREKRNQ